MASHVSTSTPKTSDRLFLNNMLRVNPLYIETALQACPLLNSALVIRDGKGFYRLLFEPKSWDGGEEGLVDRV
jgi:hypothetical protein